MTIATELIANPQLAKDTFLVDISKEEKHWTMGNIKKYKVGIFISLLVLIVGYTVNYYFNPFATRIRWLENEIPQYHLITKEDSINTKIASLFSSRGFVYMKTQNREKIAIGVSRNGLYEKKFIGDFLLHGDSLYKKIDSDTFYIYRDKEKYCFILGKIINEN